MQGFAPQHLAAEDAAEVAGDGVDGGFHGWLTVGGGIRVNLEFEGGDRAIGDAARDDPVEVAGVGGDGEREAVRGDALRDVDADGGYLLLGDASAGDGPKVISGEDV